MSFKINLTKYLYLVTWQETEYVRDDYDNRGGTYPTTVDKYTMVSDVNDLQKYVAKKGVKFF